MSEKTTAEWYGDHDVGDDSEEDPTFETDDITLAAYLNIGFPILYTEWEGKKCFWIFEDSDELGEEVEVYLAGEAVANLKEYNGIIASLKREMYDEQNRISSPRRRRVVGRRGSH